MPGNSIMKPGWLNWRSPFDHLAVVGRSGHTDLDRERSGRRQHIKRLMQSLAMIDTTDS